ncbi:DUF5979 domain-containing protein [Demequina litorisediminis]|uniref:DUF5979 domain-containing protein n=1 Tax=Demequina litorisediminis TaxID=1849022 RepID=UPI0024E0633E|nr:DUF5979 domain-containing protein [Demequina litorisediminis]
MTPSHDTASLEAAMRIVDDVESAAPGETVTVETTLTNTGKDSLWHRSAVVDVSGALDDATMGMVAASRGTADYDESAQQIVWRGTLAAGESATIRHELVVGANYVGDQDVTSRVAGADVVNCSGEIASCGAAFAVSFGSLEVAHSSTGDAAGASWLPAMVETEVMCVSPDASHSVRRPVTLAVDGDWSIAAGLPLGYTCTVVPDAGIAGTSTVTPSTAIVGVVPEVAVVTDFDSAGVDVRVDVDGNAASTGRVPAEVVVDVVCRHTDAGVLVDQAVTVVPGGTGYAFAGLPPGTSCEGTVGDYGQDSTDLSAASVSLDTSAPVQLVAVLTYAQGSLTVQSSVQGEGAGETWVPDSIKAQVVCTHPVDGVVVDQILTVPADGARAVDGIRVGSVCDVTGQADQADEISLVDAQTITAGGATVELVSVYSANALRVTTAVVGSGAGEAWVPDAFTTSVVCSRDGLGEVYSRDFVQAAGSTFTIAGLPLGARCAVHQDDAGADALTYGPSESVEVRGTSSVTVRNTFKAGTLDVAAAVRGTAAAEAWVPSQFVLEATCSHPDYGTFIDGTVSVGSGAAAGPPAVCPWGLSVKSLQSPNLWPPRCPSTLSP